MPQRDIGGVISGKLSLPQAKTRYEAGKFDVVAGRSGSGNLAALPPTQLNNLGNDLVELSCNYDKVIMDLGAGIDRTVRNLAIAQNHNCNCYNGADFTYRRLRICKTINSNKPIC